jgi:phage repressor protein C with HTH and peptisase S24 domain
VTAQARVEELSIALENLQAYNNTLPNEVHVLYDQLHPNVPPEVAAMGVGASGAAGGGPYGELDLFGAPLSMNIADDRSPKASNGAGAAKDTDN